MWHIEDEWPCRHEWGEEKPHPMVEGATIRYCQRCGTDSIRAARNDGPKRPPPLSPEERKKRAEGRDRGLLNDGSEG